MISCDLNGFMHWHATSSEARGCWEYSRTGGVVRPHEVHSSPGGPMRVSERQLAYIADLGGNTARARGMTRTQASAYIDELKAMKKGGVSMSEASTPPIKIRVDPRLDLVKGMIDLIPSGYYAVRKEEGAPITFLRVSRPASTSTSTRFAGAIKIQSQHGDRLENELVLWPSGQWTVYSASAIEPLLLLVADHRDASMLYASEIGSCMRCNAALTDDRSRHYGIGPECETKEGWEWVIPTVDEHKPAFR